MYHIAGNNVGENNISGDAYGTDDYDQNGCDIEFFCQICIIHDHGKTQWRKIKLRTLYITSVIYKTRGQFIIIGI